MYVGRSITSKFIPCCVTNVLHVDCGCIRATNSCRHWPIEKRFQSLWFHIVTGCFQMLFVFLRSAPTTIRASHCDFCSRRNNVERSHGDPKNYRIEAKLQGLGNRHWKYDNYKWWNPFASNIRQKLERHECLKPSPYQKNPFYFMQKMNRENILNATLLDPG